LVSMVIICFLWRKKCAICNINLLVELILLTYKLHLVSNYFHWSENLHNCLKVILPFASKLDWHNNKIQTNFYIHPCVHDYHVKMPHCSLKYSLIVTFKQGITKLRFCNSTPERKIKFWLSFTVKWALPVQVELITKSSLQAKVRHWL